MFDFEKTVWMGAKDIGLYVGRSPNWVENYASEWTEEYIPDRIRWVLLDGVRRYYRPDVDAKFRPRPVGLPKRTSLGLRAAMTTSGRSRSAIPEDTARN